MCIINTHKTFETNMCSLFFSVDFSSHGAWPFGRTLGRTQKVLLLAAFGEKRLNLLCFLAAFHKMAKSDYQLRHVCLSRPSFSPCLFANNNSPPIGRISIKFRIWGFFFRKFVQKIYVWLKFDKANGSFTWTHVYIDDNNLLNSPWNEKYFMQKLYRKSKQPVYV